MIGSMLPSASRDIHILGVLSAIFTARTHVWYRSE